MERLATEAGTMTDAAMMAMDAGRTDGETGEKATETAGAEETRKVHLVDRIHAPTRIRNSLWVRRRETR